MSYVPGKVHAKRLLPDGTPPPNADPNAREAARRRGSTVTIVPSAERIKDPTDDTVVLSGVVVRALVAGEAEVELPPSALRSEAAQRRSF